MMPIRLTPAVKVILAICVAIFLVQLTGSQFGFGIAGVLALVPAAFVNHFAIWQIATYAFVHVDPLYLVLNLLMVAFIGSELEQIWGTRKFVQYYMFTVVGAGAFYLLLVLVVHGGLETPMMGSSGAVYALLAAYGILFKERVLLFMMIFPMKAKHFIWVLAAVEFFSSLSYGRAGLSSLGHLGGMGAGYLYLYGRATWSVLKRQREGGGWGSTRSAKKKSRSSGHLRLVKDDKDKNQTWH